MMIFFEWVIIHTRKNAEKSALFNLKVKIYSRCAHSDIVEGMMWVVCFATANLIECCERAVRIINLLHLFDALRCADD